MKLTRLRVSILLLLCPLAVFAHNDPVPPLDAYYTGSKIFTSDTVCAICHNGGLNTSNGNVKLTFNGAAATSYTPGATIPIQITITDPGGGRRVWGFELATRFSNAKPAGTLIAVNSNTVVSTLQFPAPANPVITHNGVVPAVASSFTFTINWTAPADGSGGNIIFRRAGNAASKRSIQWSGGRRRIRGQDLGRWNRLRLRE